MTFSMQLLEAKDDQAKKDHLNQLIEDQVKELDKKFSGAID